MRIHYELIHEEQTEGFVIRFYVTPEDMHPRDCFDESEHDIAELCDKIDRGDYAWFVAKVTASKAGVELADEYLGANLYENVRDFVADNDYYADMRAEVIRAAKEKINELTEA